MRLRLQSTTVSSSLPPLKAWFYHKSAPGSTIADLKKSICTTITSFSHENVQPDEFCCELDGFELLDELEVDGVLREGDLVLLQPKTTKTITRKRSSSSSSIISTQRTRLHRQPNPNKRKREDSSSSDSSSSDESSSDSDSSISSSDSSSSVSSVPSIRPSKLKPPVKNSIISQASSNAILPTVKPSLKTLPRESKPASGPHVPPGFGSVQTHKRNVRRRLKKRYDAAQKEGYTLDPTTLQRVPLVTPTLPKGVSEANSVALGPAVRNIDRGATKSTPNQCQMKAQTSTLVHQTPTVAQSQTQTPEPWAGMDPLALSMFSLGNKNKKKGFKSSMAMRMPRVGKKVFADEEGGAEQEQERNFIANATAEVINENGNAPISSVPSFTFTHPLRPPSQSPKTAPRTRPRLIPPSERYEAGQLPKNVFVTKVDVDVEYGQSMDAYQDGNEKKKKNGKKSAGYNESDIPPRKKQKASYWDDSSGETQIGVAPLPGAWESVEVVSGSALDTSTSNSQTNNLDRSEEIVMLDYGEDEATEDAHVNVNGYKYARSYPDFVSTDRVQRDYDTSYSQHLTIQDENEDDGNPGDVGVEELGGEEESKQVLIWTVAEDPERWEVFPKVDTEGQVKLSPGVLVGWKALTLNPATFSPEIMLHIGSIVFVSANSNLNAIVPQLIKVKLLPRPGVDSEDIELDDEGIDEEGNKTFSWNEVIDMGWRILEGIST
ncbi:hypothetical protein VKT23_017189 [Stygiomarasmius scandens]|uniref:Coilin n=1 Tax=Marasmiellus scandens TaxID=2682957 RepID=A0ABR1ISY7_9AGAR